MIQVFQADWKRITDQDVRFRIMRGEHTAVQMAWELGLYHEVASVRTIDLDLAYRYTNSVDGLWHVSATVDPQRGQPRAVEIDVVEPFVDGCRSTSVGDVMLCAGVYYVVASFGFDKIDLPDLGGAETMTARCRGAYEALMRVDFKALGFPDLQSAIPWDKLRAASGKEL